MRKNTLICPISYRLYNFTIKAAQDAIFSDYQFGGIVSNVSMRLHEACKITGNIKENLCLRQIH